MPNHGERSGFEFSRHAIGHLGLPLQLPMMLAHYQPVPPQALSVCPEPLTRLVAHRLSQFCGRHHRNEIFTLGGRQPGGSEQLPQHVQ